MTLESLNITVCLEAALHCLLALILQLGAVRRVTLTGSNVGTHDGLFEFPLLHSAVCRDQRVAAGKVLCQRWIESGNRIRNAFAHRSVNTALLENLIRDLRKDLRE